MMALAQGLEEVAGKGTGTYKGRQRAVEDKLGLI